MKLYYEKIVYGPQGPRLFLIGIKLKETYSIYFCIWKYVFYFGIKRRLGI